MANNDVYIVAGARTPIGKFNETLAKIKASDLGSVVIKEVLKRSGVPGKDVDEVIMGQTLTAGQGQNPARQAALKAGLPIEVPAYTINMLCGSGLKTVVLGYQSIRCGDSKIVITGGQENMSLSPHTINMRASIRMGAGTLNDTMLVDGLTDAMHNIHMGVTAENLAKKYNISRVEQDKYTVHSQDLAERAQQKGFFDKEIVSVQVPNRKGILVFQRDEYIKYESKFSELQELAPIFQKDGTVTAGNSSGVNDAAAAVLLMSSTEVIKRAVAPLAKIIAWAQTCVQPEVMGISPVSSVELVLTKAGWTKDDVDLYEINEAFAAQTLAVLKNLKVDIKKVNISGGAIALGHPIAASGCRILVTLLYALERTGGKRGVASLCIGGGMGIAMAVERI